MTKIPQLQTVPLGQVAGTLVLVRNSAEQLTSSILPLRSLSHTSPIPGLRLVFHTLWYLEP